MFDRLFGAGDQIRTDYLVITNDVLYLLSYTSKTARNVCYYNGLLRIMQPLFENILIIFFSGFISEIILGGFPWKRPEHS